MCQHYSKSGKNMLLLTKLLKSTCAAKIAEQCIDNQCTLQYEDTNVHKMNRVSPLLNRDLNKSVEWHFRIVLSFPNNFDIPQK